MLFLKKDFNYIKMSINQFNLGDLYNPENYNEDLDIKNIKKSTLLEYLEKMLLIRNVETKIAHEKKNNQIKGPVHLGVGQEAIAVGISEHLNKSDKIFGAHRSHSHLLALGGDVRKLFAEILGKETGHSKGMGGSMHLWDQSVGFYGSVPIVSGTVSLALGAAMACRLQRKKDVSCAYFGDGACEEGVVHESLNLASLNKEPILFVVENNLFSSHMEISLRQPYNSTARFAKANNIPHKVVDGNNVVEISNAANEFIDRSRSGQGPGFIEAVTYRWYGHVDWRQDTDVGIKRSQKEIDSWKKRDPIKRLVKSMLDQNYLNAINLEEIKNKINIKINSDWEKAKKDNYPKKSSLLDTVYKKNK